MGRDQTRAVLTAQASTLSSLREGLRSVAETAEAKAADDFTRGYLAALQDQLDASLLHHQRMADDDDVARVVRRPLVRQVLTSLSEDPTRSSDVARQLDRAQPSISRVLKELQDLNMVDISDSTDKRERLYRLTATGRVALSRTALTLPTGLRAGLRIATTVFAELWATGRVLWFEQSKKLKDELGPKYGPQVLQMLEEECRDRGVASVDSGALRFEGHAALDLVGMLASSELKIGILASLVEGLQRSEGHRLVVRAEDRSVDSWRYVAALMQEHWPDLNVRVVRKTDLVSGLWEGSNSPFVLLYDLEALARQDAIEQAGRGLQDAASEVWLLAVTADEAPEVQQDVAKTPTQLHTLHAAAWRQPKYEARA